MTPIRMSYVSNGKVSLRLPSRNQSGGTIGRVVIDDQPFKVTERLGLETFVGEVERMRPVACARVDSERVAPIRLVVGHDPTPW